MLYLPVVVFPEHPYELLGTSFSIRVDKAWVKVVFLFLIEHKVLHVSDLLATLLGSRILGELSEDCK